MQLTFNDAGRLQRIKSYDLKDGQDITMVSRITPTAGKELTILEQLLGNVGRSAVRGRTGQPGRADVGGGTQ